MKISIITPSYNQAHYIERTIQSVLTQTGDFELEYIIVDGQSNDGTLAVLDRYRQQARIVVESDRGQSDAINKGMSMATGDVVGWINSDDILLQGSLSTVADMFSANETIQWVYGRAIIIDTQDREIRRWLTTYKNLRMRRLTLARLLQENCIPQMSVFWRRSFGVSAGGLREDLHYSMDYDLWLRFMKKDRGMHIPQYLAAFRYYADCKSWRFLESQSDESYAIAQLHSNGSHRSSLWVHRLLSARMRVIYRLLMKAGA